MLDGHAQATTKRVPTPFDFSEQTVSSKVRTKPSGGDAFVRSLADALAWPSDGSPVAVHHAQVLGVTLRQKQMPRRNANANGTFSKRTIGKLFEKTL